MALPAAGLGDTPISGIRRSETLFVVWAKHRRMATDAAEHGLMQQLTFKANAATTRYGWLRLTPAYSVHLVERILDEVAVRDGLVLDPYCGTGTTALVCAERGIACDTTDINPFLLWLARAKSRRYTSQDLELFCARAT